MAYDGQPVLHEQDETPPDQEEEHDEQSLYQGSLVIPPDGILPNSGELY